MLTTLHYNLNEKTDIYIEQPFNREGSLYLVCNEKRAYITSELPKRYNLWVFQKVCDALHYLLDNIFMYLDFFVLGDDTSISPTSSM